VEEFARQYIAEIREQAPALGGVKIWEIYRKEFGDSYAIGRDRFCDIYESMNLKLRKKRRGVRTTDSTHGLPTYPNQVKQLIPERFGQVVVGDITYIPLQREDGGHDFCFLNLLMDSYSKIIIGHKVAPTLAKEYSLMALQVAYTFLRAHGVDTHTTIHHTDRGVQYASYDYTEQLRLYGMTISMTENGNPKDNPEAERINQTIKNQMLAGKVFKTIDEVEVDVAKAIEFYNNRRPHDSLDKLTPMEAMNHVGRFKRCWTSWREKAIDNLAASDAPPLEAKSTGHESVA
jgi:transposase InsO family protein